MKTTKTVTAWQILQFFHQFIGFVISWFVIRGGRYLRKNHPDFFEDSISDLGGSLRKITSEVLPKPFGENLVALDSPQQINALPRWTEEIKPFLMNQLSDHTRRAYETDLKQFFLFLEGRILPDEL